jgi:hypothetical protein
VSRLNELISELRAQGRICLIPQPWNKLWNMLPERRRKGVGYEPPAPLILAAWHHTSNLEKHERFLAHLRWADDHEALEQIVDFLSGLSPEDWHESESKT